MNRWHPLGQMVRSRIREFYREPEAVFWVYCFPLLLAVVLGLAFSGGAPEPPTVDVQEVGDSTLESRIKAALDAAKQKVEILPAEKCNQRLRTGKTALIVVPDARQV